MITDRKKLWEKSKRSSLTPEEKDYLTKQLQILYETHETQEDHMDLLLLLDALELDAYFTGDLKAILEKLIIFPDNCLAAAEALNLLCWDSTSTAEQLTHVKAFLKGVDWDLEDEGQVRLRSISILGSYVRETNDRECLKLLLDVFDDEQMDTVLRASAYKSICRAVGREWKDIPHITEWDRPAIDHLIDHEMLNDARNYLTQE
jgi:hypothetical protein